MSPEVNLLLWRFQDSYDRGQYVQALALVDSAVALVPERPRLRYIRGDVLTTLYRFNEAEQSFLDALALDSRYPSAAYRIANNAFFLGRNRKALTFYEQERQTLGTKVDSSSISTIWAQIGRVYARLGVADSAHMAYEHATAYDGASAQVWEWKAELAEDAGQLDQAFAHIQVAVTLNPAESSYRYLAGALLYRLGRAEQAVDHLRAAVEGAPWHAGAHYNLGRSLVALGRLEEGTRYLDATDSLQTLQADIVLARFAAQNRPEDRAAWIALGMLLEQAGQHDEARHAYRIARQVGIAN